MESAAHSALTSITIVALAALACGMLMERLRQPAIVGYIAAGLILGPSGIALVEDRAGIDTLAEMGVLMLLFLIGMELSLRAFRRVWRLALGVVTVQICASIGGMLLCARVLGWTTSMAVLLGFVIALSSTAVAVKILESLGELRTRTGRIAVGVLIAQDLAVVPMMLAVNAMGGDAVDWLVVPKVLLSVAVLVGLIMYLSAGPKLELPFSKIVAGHADLMPLAALGFCFGMAALSGLFGLSAAYGAFLAGLVIGNSTDRHAMIAATQPIQSVLMMVFFLSVGLLVDLDYIWANLTMVVVMFMLIAVFKTAVNVTALGLLGQAWHTAFLAGIMISQVGEFSFLLAVVAVDARVISPDDSRLIIAVTVMSLALSPIWVITGRRLQLLARYGITESRELMQLVYGPEVELVSEVLSDARTETQRRLRLAALWLRRRRAKRQRRMAVTQSRPAGPPALAGASAPIAAIEMPVPAVKNIEPDRTAEPKPMRPPPKSPVQSDAEPVTATANVPGKRRARTKKPARKPESGRKRKPNPKPKSKPGKNA